MSALTIGVCCCFVQYLFFFWLCWVFIAACGLSLIVASRCYSSLQCVGFSLWWFLLLRSTGSRLVGFSSCSVWAQQLWHTGLVAPQRVRSSQTRARTRVPCIGRRILNHCTTREVLCSIFEAGKVFFFFLIYLFFGCVGSLLLHAAFL